MEETKANNNNNYKNKVTAEMLPATQPLEQTVDNEKKNSIQSPNIDSVVDKAKAAASKLWLLLHAQNCRVGSNRCAHLGCKQAKLLHLHIKTCPASHQADCMCPSGYRGCNQSRKLLAHFKKCRAARLRQQQTQVSAGIVKSSSTASQRRGFKTQCLICSLVARHAKKTMMMMTQSQQPQIQSSMSYSRKLESNPNICPVIQEEPEPQEAEPDCSSRSSSPTIQQHRETTTTAAITPTGNIQIKYSVTFSDPVEESKSSEDDFNPEMPPPAPRPPMNYRRRSATFSYE